MPKEFLISQFMDNELNLDEKAEMVRCIGNDPEFAAQTLSWIKLEQSLREPVTDKVPERFFPPVKQRSRMGPMLRIAAAFLVVALASVFGTVQWTRTPLEKPSSVSQRFVVYLPKADTVEIAGTFTNWGRLPLNRVGESGYWEINLELSRGEHRFSYIVGGGRTMADPTIFAKETDDFGGTNSVIFAGDRA